MTEYLVIGLHPKTKILIEIARCNSKYYAEFLKSLAENIGYTEVEIQTDEMSI